jgi:hypothetical protein
VLAGVQVKATSGTSDDTTLPGKDSKAAPEPEPAPAHPEPSAASSPAKAKPAEDATDKAAGNTWHGPDQMKLAITTTALPAVVGDCSRMLQPAWYACSKTHMGLCRLSGIMTSLPDAHNLVVHASPVSASRQASQLMCALLPAACATEDVEGQDSEKDDTAMTDAAAEGEPEVQSPLKKAPEPEPDADKPAAAEEAAKSDSDKPATQAPALPATSSKALAAGKRKGLLVAKSATGEEITLCCTSSRTASRSGSTAVCLPEHAAPADPQHMVDIHVVLSAQSSHMLTPNCLGLSCCRPRCCPQCRLQAFSSQAQARQAHSTQGCRQHCNCRRQLRGCSAQDASCPDSLLLLHC